MDELEKQIDELVWDFGQFPEESKVKVLDLIKAREAAAVKAFAEKVKIMVQAGANGLAHEQARSPFDGEYHADMSLSVSNSLINAIDQLLKDHLGENSD